MYVYTHQAAHLMQTSRLYVGPRFVPASGMSAADVASAVLMERMNTVSVGHVQRAPSLTCGNKANVECVSQRAQRVTKENS